MIERIAGILVALCVYVYVIRKEGGFQFPWTLLPHSR